MNRYKITFTNDKELLIYKRSQEELLQSDWSMFGDIKSIELYTDKSHEEYITKIKEMSTFLGHDQHNHEVYKCDYYKGHIIIRLAKDNEDDDYYDYAQYTEYVNGRFIEPILKNTVYAKRNI